MTSNAAKPVTSVRLDELQTMHEQNSAAFSRLRGTKPGDARRVFETLDEAAPYLSYRAMSPDSSAAGSVTAALLEVEVSSDAVPAAISVKLVLGDPKDGSYIEAKPYWKDASPIDFEATAKASTIDYDARVKAEGAAGCPDCEEAVRLVRVHGQPGNAKKAGYAEGGLDSGYYPSYVKWWESGILYEIYGTRGEDATSLEALLGVAESMR